MGLKKMFIRIACILCILSAVFALPGCANKRVGKYLFDLTDENRPPYEVVLISYKKKGSVKNLIRLGQDYDFERLGYRYIYSAYFDGSIYSVERCGNYGENLNVHIYVMKKGELLDDVYVGNFGLLGENPTKEDLYQYSPSLYDLSYYYNKTNFDEASNAIPMPKSVLTTYSNGCIYVCDANKSVKYDIKKDELIENPEEAAEVFTVKYVYETSEDENTLYITDLNTNEQKEITFEKIAESCPEIKEFLDIYGDKKFIVDGGKLTSYTFENSFGGDFEPLKVIDGKLFITINVMNVWMVDFPVVLKYDFETETFEFCVAGDSNTVANPVPIVK